MVEPEEDFFFQHLNPLPGMNLRPMQGFIRIDIAHPG
jgi:hypothetical protein